MTQDIKCTQCGTPAIKNVVFHGNFAGQIKCRRCGTFYRVELTSQAPTGKINTLKI